MCATPTAASSKVRRKRSSLWRSLASASARGRKSASCAARAISAASSASSRGCFLIPAKASTATGLEPENTGQRSADCTPAPAAKPGPEARGSVEASRIHSGLPDCQAVATAPRALALVEPPELAAVPPFRLADRPQRALRAFDDAGRLGHAAGDEMLQA